MKWRCGLRRGFFGRRGATNTSAGRTVLEVDGMRVRHAFFVVVDVVFMFCFLFWLFGCLFVVLPLIVFLQKGKQRGRKGKKKRKNSTLYSWEAKEDYTKCNVYPTVIIFLLVIFASCNSFCRVQGKIWVVRTKGYPFNSVSNGIALEGTRREKSRKEKYVYFAADNSASSWMCCAFVFLCACVCVCVCLCVCVILWSGEKKWCDSSLVCLSWRQHVVWSHVYIVFVEREGF